VQRLIDIGERKLTDLILSKYVDGNFGDDCSELIVGGAHIVVTTDPVPRPAAFVIGGDPDLYWMGWLLVTINASDLAAAGATPLGFLAALDLEREMPLSELERLLSGIRDACRHEGLLYIGGNVREAKQLAAVGTAIGTTNSMPGLRRVGASDGDQLVIIGSGGRFWADAIAIRQGGQVTRETSPLFRPTSQLAPMKRLREAGLIAAAMDNSDGLLPSLSLLGKANNLAAVLDLGVLNMHRATADAAKSLGIRPAARLWLGWGDWNVVCAVHPKDLARVLEQASVERFEATHCGYFEAARSGVFVRNEEVIVPAPRLESERFASDSWFATGIESYIDALKKCDLPSS